MKIQNQYNVYQFCERRYFCNYGTCNVRGLLNSNFERSGSGNIHHPHCDSLVQSLSELVQTSLYSCYSTKIKMSGKTFNCPIHGHLELSPLSVKVIDTPQFQRLRDISQLGGVYYVFPGAASKRFEHCIGVAYLARYFIEKLASQQPELNISSVDILCVELAGLCHDLGHGPFSHLFDAKVLPQLGVKHFVHEHASIGILDILISENNLMSEFERNGLTADDIHFIKELILGDADEAPIDFNWKGRGDKTFLYDIVANKRNGIDVDKFDYFARDCHVLGVSKSFDCLRLMKFARYCFKFKQLSYTLFCFIYSFDILLKCCLVRVHRVNRDGVSNLEICFHKKEAWNLFEVTYNEVH